MPEFLFLLFPLFVYTSFPVRPGPAVSFTHSLPLSLWKKSLPGKLAGGDLHQGYSLDQLPRPHLGV